MGTRIAFLPEYTKPTILREIAGEEKFTVSFPFGAPGTEELKEKRVLRSVYDDLTYEEWRIGRVVHRRDENGERFIDVEGMHIRFDLADCGRVAQVQANGQVDMDFDPPALALEDHLSIIMTSPGFPAHFSTLENAEADPVAISYQRDTPWSAIKALAAAAGLEADVARSVGLYGIRFVQQVGSAGPVARLRYAKNILGLTRDRDTSKLATRVFPSGAEIDGFALTIADALWEITAVDEYSGRVMLADEPIAFVDQLTNLRARKFGTTSDVLITDTFLDTQEIELESVTELSVGDYLQFRNPDGGELVYLDRPATIAEYGIYASPEVGQFTDIPFVNNLLREAFLDLETLTAWAAIGAATIELNTDRIYHRFGVGSQRVRCTSDADGIESDWRAVVPIGPVLDEDGNVTAEGRPYFTVQMAFWILTGTVRLELDVDTVGDGSNIVTYPDTGAKATSNESGRWVDSLTMNADLYQIGAKRVRVRLVQDGATAADFYLDAAQLTQTNGGAPTFYDGRGSNELWHAANLALAEFGEPVVTYDVSPYDLFRQDQDAFEADELVLGASVIVDDTDLDATVDARIVSLRQVIADELQTDIRISNSPAALLQLQEREKARRRSRLGVGSGGTGSGPGTPPTPPPEGSTAGGQIDHLAITKVLVGATWYHVITWTHNQAVQDDGVGRFTINLIRGIDVDPDTTLVPGGDPKLELGVSDDVDLFGSSREVVVPSSDHSDLHTYYYRLELYDGATLVMTREDELLGFYVV